MHAPFSYHHRNLVMLPALREEMIHCIYNYIACVVRDFKLLKCTQTIKTTNEWQAINWHTRTFHKLMYFFYVYGVFDTFPYFVWYLSHSYFYTTLSIRRVDIIHLQYGGIFTLLRFHSSFHKCADHTIPVWVYYVTWKKIQQKNQFTYF